jgi:hypothetical protein
VAKARPTAITGTDILYFCLAPWHWLHGLAVERANGAAAVCRFGFVMNSPERQLSSPRGLGFSLLAGALAGFLFAAGVSLLQPVIWAVGAPVGVGDQALLREAMARTTPTLLCCVGIGLAAGIVWGVLPARANPASRQWAAQLLPALWVLASFVWAISGPVNAAIEMPITVIDAILTAGVAATAYFFWRLLLEWLARGYIGRLVLTICATGVALWIPFGWYLVLP